MQNESEKSLLIRSFQSGMVKAIAYQVTTIALPFVLAALTFAAGAIDKSTPWMWVLTATCLSFAGVATGIVQFKELLQKNRIEGNLVCIGPRIAIDLTDPNSYSLGLNLQSTSEVPIEFEIGKISTKLQSKYPPNKPFELSRFTIPPRGIGFFNDNAIRLETPSLSVVEGLVDVTIKYGRPENLKYLLHVKRQVFLKFNSDQIVENIAWNETI